MSCVVPIRWIRWIDGSTRLDRLDRCHQWHCSPHVDSCVVIDIILLATRDHAVLRPDSRLAYPIESVEDSFKLLSINQLRLEEWEISIGENDRPFFTILIRAAPEGQTLHALGGRHILLSNEGKVAKLGRNICQHIVDNKNFVDKHTHP